jgi:hypothetical protein
MWLVAVLCEGLDVSRRGLDEYLQRHAQESGAAGGRRMSPGHSDGRGNAAQ